MLKHSIFLIYKTPKCEVVTPLSWGLPYIIIGFIQSKIPTLNAPMNSSLKNHTYLYMHQLYLQFLRSNSAAKLYLSALEISVSSSISSVILTSFIIR